MRNLKFRAWDKKRKEWYGASSEDLLTFKGFGLFGECTMLCMPQIEYLQHLEVSQYTGIKDKNGVEIYESDILRLGSTKHDGHNNTYVPLASADTKLTVSFKDGCFTTEEGTLGDIIQWHQLEVMGNIHENKDLLK